MLVSGDYRLGTSPTRGDLITVASRGPPDCWAAGTWEDLSLGTLYEVSLQSGEAQIFNQRKKVPQLGGGTILGPRLYQSGYDNSYIHC